MWSKKALSPVPYGGRGLREADLRSRILTALAFLSSLVAFVVIAGGGLSLYAIEVSGERGTGVLIALLGAIAFGAVMFLIFVRRGVLAEGIRRTAAIGAGILGAIPPAVLAFAAIRFAGLPIGSRLPLVDWLVLAAGIFFALGALAILALGHRRSQESDGLPTIHMQQIRNAQQQLRSAFESDTRIRLEPGGGAEDDIRVKRV